MGTSDVYRALWRHRYLMLFVTLLVVVVALVLTARQTELYTASTVVRVQQNVRSPEEAFGALLTGERLARTYERIAETNSVRGLVKAKLGRSVPTDAVLIDAAQLENLELLRIDVTHENPKVAATVANALPPALAEFTRETGSFRDTITVVERATAPTSPSSPNPTLNLLLAVLLGTILACGLALLREATSDRIENVGELERISGHPVIAVVPNLKFRSLEAFALPRLKERSFPRTPSTTRETHQVKPARSTEPSSRWSARG
jgi:capsular polysaccharide biosynthesis protein